MSEFNSIIYINGRRHRCTTPGPVFFVDTPDMPMARCSQHRLTCGTVASLRRGGSVRTSGNVYSLLGPEWTEFTLDGEKGRVYANDWLTFGTFNCQTSAALSPELREIVDELLTELKERAESWG